MMIKEMIFTGQQIPTPRITEYKYQTSKEIKDKIKEIIEKEYGVGIDMEIIDIRVRIFEK